MITCPCNDAPRLLLVDISKGVIDNEGCHCDIAGEGNPNTADTALHPGRSAEYFTDSCTHSSTDVAFGNWLTVGGCSSLIPHLGSGVGTCIPAAQVEDDRSRNDWHFTHTDIKSNALLT